ncbi:Acyl-CoA thioesterase 2 [Polaribacter huanghezhanensis]|uniref:acyl-CoA thioesterase n=1 Tax=Polaribacter huanghezhanensis TaxID=1354726 RepID=UPI00264847B0|nr:acyl-CoA thioesterase II [Polaribacter huanghezhanensis]WKD85528.1 Acyl-CoA thioesterase 2 [Polaribacter huanghezhanensis]
MNSIEDLIAVLTLEKKAENQYVGVSETIGSPNVFGGQVLAQALSAANNSVSNHRVLHSLHAYFLEAGNLEIPITYIVNNMRNGGSFSTRRVTAKQKDKTIFILSASFHKKEDGYEHQQALESNIKHPEELLSWSDMLEQFGDFLPKKMKSFLEIERPIEFKPTFIVNPLDLKDLPPFLDVWFRVKGKTTDLSIALKQQILTYISDYNILNATLYPNASKANYGNTQIASLDHSMWFFREFDLDDWMLYKTESPTAFGARGFARGNIYSRKGDLIASVAQEGLIRPVKK